MVSRLREHLFRANVTGRAFVLWLCLAAVIWGVPFNFEMGGGAKNGGVYYGLVWPLHIHTYGPWEGKLLGVSAPGKSRIRVLPINGLVALAMTACASVLALEFRRSRISRTPFCFRYRWSRHQRW